MLHFEEKNLFSALTHLRKEIIIEKTDTAPHYVWN